MEASSNSSQVHGGAEAHLASSPYAKHTSLRGAAGYRGWRGAAGLPQSLEEKPSDPAESSTAWANRVRSQKHDAAPRASTDNGRLRESASRSGSRNVNRVDSDGNDVQPRRGTPAWKLQPQTAAVTPWDRLSQNSRPPSRQVYSSAKLWRTPEEGEAYDTVSRPNRPPSRRKIEGRVVSQGSVAELVFGGEDPETYDTFSRGFSRGGARERPAWNQGAAGAASKPAWTTGPQPLRVQKLSRPSSQVSSRQASREGSVMGDASYQIEEQLSKESSRTDLVSISSHEEGGNGRVGSRAAGGGGRPGSRMSLLDVSSYQDEVAPGSSKNDENREPGSRPSSEVRALAGCALGIENRS